MSLSYSTYTHEAAFFLGHVALDTHIDLLVAAAAASPPSNVVVFSPIQPPLLVHVLYSPRETSICGGG